MGDNLPDANNVLLKLQNNLDLVDATSGVCIAVFIIADKPPNRGVFVGLLKKAWANMGELRVSTISDNVFAVIAPDQTIATRIIECGPWNVASYCCTIQAWPTNRAFEEIPSHLVVYWVQLHGVPLGQYSVENAKTIGEAYGAMMMVEDLFPMFIWDTGLPPHKIVVGCHESYSNWVLAGKK